MGSQKMGYDPKLHDIIDSKLCNLCAQNILMSGIKRARRHLKYCYYFYCYYYRHVQIGSYLWGAFGS